MKLSIELDVYYVGVQTLTYQIVQIIIYFTYTDETVKDYKIDYKS